MYIFLHGLLVKDNWGQGTVISNVSVICALTPINEVYAEYVIKHVLSQELLFQLLIMGNENFEKCFYRPKSRAVALSILSGLLVLLALWVSSASSSESEQFDLYHLVIIFSCALIVSFFVLNFTHTLNRICICKDRIKLKFALMEEIVIPVDDITRAEYPLRVGQSSWCLYTQTHGKLYFLARHEFSSLERNIISKDLKEILKTKLK